MSEGIGESLSACTRRVPAFALVGALFVLFAGYATPASALGIFESLFGNRYQRFEPSYRHYDPPPPIRRRTIVKRPRPKVQHASLPPVREMPKVPKEPVVLSDAEIVAGLMKDPTLRRGDIVMFPKGPKVFTGSSGSSHSPRDFEDIRSSRAVADGTRRAVLALTRATPQAASVKIAASPPRTAPRRDRPRGDEPRLVGDVSVTGSLPRAATR
jgi:hypothetical protein